MEYLWFPIALFIYSIGWLAYHGMLGQFIKELIKIYHTDFSEEDSRPKPDLSTPWIRPEPKPHYLADYTPPVNNPMLTGDQFMSREDKQAYLLSTKWQLLRREVLARDNYQCQSCHSTYDLSVHHLHYESLGNESPDHLVTLCQPCHSKLHELLGYDRKSHFEISRLKNEKTLNVSSSINTSNSTGEEA